MHCSRCGKEVSDGAERCPFCSEMVLLVDGPVVETIPSESEAVSLFSPEIEPGSSPEIPKQSLWMLAILIFVTGGIYEAFWYRKVARSLNVLEGRKKFSPVPFWFFLVGYSIYFLLSMVKGSNESLGIDTEGVKTLSGVIWLTMTSFIILVCFRIMDTLKAWHGRENRVFASNRLYTLILNVFYVQHKLNRM